ncbi:MAG: BACON domain-containing protein, partial [Bacteroidales bacterium]|nr:BACON domain-containing protein [Bacteroidales bacterium]
MKKILLFAAAILALAGCKDPNGTTPSAADEITVAPESKTVGGEGGNVQVIVTSTGDWTLSAKNNQTYDWVTADKISGVDGDIVKFVVEPNLEEQKTAEFVFACGKATAPFTVISMPGELPTITVTSGAEVKGTYEAGKFTVAVALKNVSESELEVECSEEWLRKLIVLEGDTQNSVNVDFGYDALSGLEARTAEITFKGGAANPVKVT